MADVSRLPGPCADHWDWQRIGACRDEDPALFFSAEGERGSARRSRERAAKRVCVRCPVLMLCRHHALRTREPYGVWGGLSEDEREQIHRSGDLSIATALASVDDLEPVADLVQAG